MLWKRLFRERDFGLKVGDKILDNIRWEEGWGRGVYIRKDFGSVGKGLSKSSFCKL